MLGSLQRFILLKVLERGEKTGRDVFRDFYRTKNPAPRGVHGGAKEKYQEEIITKSLMSLIDRELMIGYGRRTPHKWFVTHARLTKLGVKKAVEILEQKQIKLPLK